MQQLITEMKNLIFSSEEEGFTEDDTQRLKQVTPDTMISFNIQCTLFVELIYVVVQFNLCVKFYFPRFQSKLIIIHYHAYQQTKEFY